MENLVEQVVLLVTGATIGFFGQYLSSRIQNTWSRSQRQLEKLEDLAMLAYEIRDVTASGILSNLELMKRTRVLIARLGVNVRVHNPSLRHVLESLSCDLNMLLTTNRQSSGNPSPELATLVKALYDHTEKLLSEIETESTKLRS